MDIVLIVNGLDLSKRVSTYFVTKKVTYTEIVTGLDNTEYPFPGAIKTEATFSLLPATEAEDAEFYDAVSDLVFQASFTDPQKGGAAITKRVRVTSDLESTFLLKSVDGLRRYKGGTITLREL